MFKLTFFVPEEHCEAVKQAIFEVGAGVMDNYDHCCWQTLGGGQFRPKNGASPFAGEVGTIQTVPEYRVETVVDKFAIHAVVAALKAAHPYETPAYEIIELMPF